MESLDRGMEWNENVAKGDPKSEDLVLPVCYSNVQKERYLFFIWHS
jgi:hypothetical protein